jgi:hypothetical protein
MTRNAWKWLASAALMGGACSPSGASPPVETASPAAKAPAVKRAGQTEGGSDAATDFVLGNVAFILFHELGHAMISEFQLPVLGREEDAVDNFASMLLTPDNEDPEMDASILVNAMAGWFASAEMVAPEDIAWWDEHGPDQQRAYQIGCVLYGSKAGAYDELAEAIGLPEERRERCPAEYEAVSSGWGQLLAPHLLEEGEAPQARFAVSYDDGGDHGDEQALLKESQLLESIGNEISTSFRLTRQLRMKGAKCGQPNAFWDPEAGEITICYELIRDYYQLYNELQAAPDQTGG